MYSAITKLMVRIRDCDGACYEGELYDLTYDGVVYVNGVKIIKGYQVRLQPDPNCDDPPKKFTSVLPDNIEVFTKNG